ncbi:phage holin family protein [Nostoc sp. MG11]|uniref:phage holin family protein n=1 Tax=Nostoc sp. MG11 TaxID=2721166 RepID=UPI0029FF2953|nr:phage holin family protein [Nostoc sp. MG11]
MSTAVFGLLNAILLFIPAFFDLPSFYLTLDLFFLIINPGFFALTTYLVENFRLR